MIYEMTLNYIETLQQRWTGVQDSLINLRDALPASSAIRNTIGGLVDDVQDELDAINAALPDVEGFPAIPDLLDSTRAILDDSRIRLENVTSQTENLLPVLRDSSTQSIAVAAEVVSERLNGLQNHIEEGLQEIEELSTEEGARANLRGIRGSVDNIATYPVLTQETGFPSAPSSISGGGLGMAPLGQQVEAALREVLSWRPNKSDPKGFMAALSQSFTSKEEDGRKEWVWTRRSYAVQADIGAVTGAQASIYARATNALEKSLPLLDGLRPLLSDADEENTGAIRAIVDSNLNELVGELGRQGGPRVQRIESLFEQLLGPNPDNNPGQVEGQLGQLRDEFGLTTAQVNTIEEEQNLTNFFILVDYVNSLHLSWENQSNFFDRTGSDVFLGTQLVLVNRSLAVVAESVQETRFAMDSVFLDEAERQTVELHFGNEAPLFVAELLDWVEHFAAEEGPRLIRDGGKRGVIALQSTVERLARLTREAMTTQYGGIQNPATLPAGYRTARVQRSLQEAASHLDEMVDLARQIQLQTNGNVLPAPNGIIRDIIA